MTKWGMNTVLAAILTLKRGMNSTSPSKTCKDTILEVIIWFLFMLRNCYEGGVLVYIMQPHPVIIADY